MPSMFLNEIDIRNSITEIFSTSTQVDCAVAFIGEKALEVIPKNCEVRMICNLESGATNPYAVRALIDNGVEIRTSKNLHAKVFIGDDFTIVGSANLSANGLGLEGNEIKGWIEAGYKVITNNEQKKVKEWWLEHWGKSKVITINDINRHISIWSSRRKLRPNIATKKSLFDDLSSYPDSFKDRRIYLVITTEYLSAEAEKTLVNVQGKLKNDTNVEAYEGWEELPENAYLIDFYVGPKGGVKSTGIYKSPEKKIVIEFTNSKQERKTLFLCYKVNNILGYSVTKEDTNKIKSFIEKALKNEHIGFGDSCAKYIKLMDVVDYYANKS